MIDIIVNGELRQVPADANIRKLVEILGHTDRRIAVERNGEIVPKSLHADTQLAAGDKLEIVVAVGGG